MRQFIRDLFSEKGSVSMMRVMCFMVCCTACKLALDHGDIGSVSVLLGAAFSGKIGQKALETKDSSGGK